MVNLLRIFHEKFWPKKYSEIFYDFSCNCPSKYSGGRCQTLSRRFSGSGWAWFSPLSTCENSHLSFQFRTSEKNGLILYNGPMRKLNDNDNSGK